MPVLEEESVDTGLEPEESGPLLRRVSRHDLADKPPTDAKNAILVVVDDEPQTLMEDMALLRCFGFRIVLARSYEEAMQALDRLAEREDTRRRLSGVFVDCHLDSAREYTDVDETRDGVRLLEEMRGDPVLREFPAVAYTRFAETYRTRLAEIEMPYVDRERPLWVAEALHMLSAQAAAQRRELDTVHEPVLAVLSDAVLAYRNIKRLTTLNVWERACQGSGLAMLLLLVLWRITGVILVHPTLCIFAALCFVFQIRLIRFLRQRYEKALSNN